MAVLTGLKPKKVFEYFEEICKIPHGSGNTKMISDFLVDFAKSRKLWFYQDKINNVIIKKAPSPGYENADPIILQGHIDMVCEKAPGCETNMEKDGLSLKTDGEKIWADGTTLGADNGIAVAMMLAILDDRTILCPPVEAVFTVDEEVGLIGADAIDASKLCGKRMINIDSEDEGIFTVSCAGGEQAKCILPIQREEFEGGPLEVFVGGLLGGHSGIEINKGRANSNILLGRILDKIQSETDMRILSVSGGLKDNAIPRESTAEIIVADKDKAELVCKEMDKIFKNEYSLTDADVFVKTNACERYIPLNKAATDKTIAMLCCLPNGIMEMSAGIKDLVQTSLNMGILKTDENHIIAEFGIRSSIDSQKEMLIRRITRFMESLGGKCETSGRYSGWEYKKDSPLRNLMAEVYEDMYGKKPVIQAIHAGLECGTFAGKIEGFDGISIGPDMKDIHTFSETLYVKSTERVYNMLVEALKRMN